jgi:hypothetical protein
MKGTLSFFHAFPLRGKEKKSGIVIIISYCSGKTMKYY